MSTPQRRRPASFRRRWTAEEESLLGVKPDRVLARELGRTVEAVKGRRQRRRIRLLRGWTPEEVKLLGTRPDREVAVLVGRAPYAVTGKRIKLGIPRCYDRRHWRPDDWRAQTARRYVPQGRVWWSGRLRTQGRPRCGAQIHRQPADVLSRRKHRRCALARDPPGQHHALAAHARGAGEDRRHRRLCEAVGRHRAH